MVHTSSLQYLQPGLEAGGGAGVGLPQGISVFLGLETSQLAGDLDLPLPLIVL